MEWYALRSKPNKEEALRREVGARGHEAYCPSVRVHPVNPRSRTVRPYFPGYLFVHTELEAVGETAFSWVPFGLGLVSFGGHPASVPDALISAIRRRVDEINRAGGEVLESLHHGQAVTIQAGPFSGCEAVFDARLSGSDRVRVLLRFLSRREVTLDLPAGYVERKQNVLRATLR